MISILMPLYNGAEFLQNSVESVITQTYTDWELLIGINGLCPSKNDKITRKIRLFHDDRIKSHIFVEKSKTKTLNRLVQLAKNDIICLLDVDDYWLPNKLEKQLPFIDKYDGVGSDIEYFGDHTGSPNLFLGELSEAMFSYQNPLVNSAIMLKKTNAQWDEAWEGLDDYNLWVDLLSKQKIFYNVPEVLLKHRIHKKSAFNQFNGDLSNKLKSEKLRKLEPEEAENLSRLIDSKRWKL